MAPQAPSTLKTTATVPVPELAAFTLDAIRRTIFPYVRRTGKTWERADPDGLGGIRVWGKKGKAPKGAYVVRVLVTRPDGSRVHPRTSWPLDVEGQTLRDLRDMAEAWKAEQRGSTRAGLSSKVEDVYPAFLDAHYGGRRSEPDARQRWEDYIRPRFGKRKLSEVDTHEVNKLHTYLTDTLRHPSLADSCVSNLCAFQTWLMKEGIISQKLFIRPAKNGANPRAEILESSSIQALVKLFTNELDRERPRVAHMAAAVILFTGQRAQEVCRMRYSDIREYGGSYWWILKPETRKIADIPQAVWLGDMPRKIIAKMRENAESDYVFASPKTGEPIANPKGVFRRFQKKQGLTGPVLPSACRNTLAVVTKAKGLDEKLALGHMAQTTAGKFYTREAFLPEVRESIFSNYHQFLMEGGESERPATFGDVLSLEPAFSLDTVHTIA